MAPGWRVVAGALVGMVLANGFFTYAFTILVNPIRAEFGASLEQVMYSLTLGTLGGLFLSPVIGIMIDRYSVRHIMSLGGLITVAGLYGMAQAQSLLVFNLTFGITMALSLGTMSSMTGSAVVSRWFTGNRGKALGVAAMGTSVGGMLFPALLTFWVESVGWRGAVQNTALLTLFVVTPFMWLTIRNRPQDLGVQPAQMPQADWPEHGNGLCLLCHHAGEPVALCREAGCQRWCYFDNDCCLIAGRPGGQAGVWRRR